MIKMKTTHLTIMFTDIKGFTSRTARSSREQLHQLLDLHDQLVIPIFKKFGGRVVKTIGDAFMVSFHSPTDAVLCGMEVQNVLGQHNEKIPEDEKIEVRVAINSGEVTIKNDDVFGEAVNIASRLEGIAEAGDIYFTESVYLAMNKNEIPTAEVGYRHFKGIPEEIKVYKVLRERKKKKGLFGREKIVTREFTVKKKGFPRVLKWIFVILVILLILFVFVKINKQKEEIKPIEPKVIEEREEIAQELERVYMDVKQAIKEGDERRARKGIDTLVTRSNELGHPQKLEDGIRELEILYKERFR
jgi:class 3 adenylate cyclase